MRSVSVHDGGFWSVFFDDGDVRVWVDIEMSDGVPVVVGVQVEQRPRPPVLVPHGKRRRRPGWEWSVVGELLEM